MTDDEKFEAHIKSTAWYGVLSQAANDDDEGASVFRMARMAAREAWNASRVAVIEEPAALLSRIPTTPEQMIAFIGSHFDSMQADGWTDTLPSKPTGDLSMVRYSLTVHDLLSAFDWSDLSKECIDAALANQKQAG